jgi:DNA polymerase-3 subunit alpha
MLDKYITFYKNLIKLCSLGYTEGLYSKYPRIDKSLILQYHEGLIATTCCLGASVPRTILREGFDAGEKEFKWWLDIFGEDYYVELQRHDIPDQIKVNEDLVRLARKYHVKIIASNDSHYVEEEDSNAHDILLCVNTGEKQSTPKMKEFADDDANNKNSRFAFYNNQFFFKSTQQMTDLFADLPEAIDNTNEIVSKVDIVNVANDLLLPNFPLPAPFKHQIDYLEFLTFEGAKAKYTILSPELDERLRIRVVRVGGQYPISHLRRGVYQDSFDRALAGGQHLEEAGEQPSFFGVGPDDQRNLVRHALSHRLERVQWQIVVTVGRSDHRGTQHVVEAVLHDVVGGPHQIGG